MSECHIGREDGGCTKSGDAVVVLGSADRQKRAAL